MAYVIEFTTAEAIVDVIDALLSHGRSVPANTVAQFLDIEQERAEHALKMAAQLGLASEQPDGTFNASHPLANYLVTSSDSQKAAILRLILEQYPPYKTFKQRLAVSLAPIRAAHQVKVLYKLETPRDDIKETLVSLGTYTRSLVSRGAGQFDLAEGLDSDATYMKLQMEVMAERERSELHVRKALGDEAAEWIEPNEVLNHLVTAYQRLSDDTEPRAPILHAGNAFESFLAQIGQHHHVNLKGNGINAKLDELAGGNHILKKHCFMAKYLGHVRNGADHGVDPETNHTWEISFDTSIQYVHVAISVIRDIVAYVNGRYLL